jgi:hypothetical protein
VQHGCVGRSGATDWTEVSRGPGFGRAILCRQALATLDCGQHNGFVAILSHNLTLRRAPILHAILRWNERV